MSNPTSEALSASEQEAHGKSGMGSLRRYAYGKIEDLLNSGQLRPGQLVSQRELVEATGATLGSVREAIPRFEAEGLLVTVPKKGLMVPSLDVAFVREAYQLRRMIELSALRQAARRIPREQIEEWRVWHEAKEIAVQESTGGIARSLIDQVQRYDWAMHAEIVAALGNRLVDNVYRVTAIKIRMAVQSRLQVTGDNAARILKEHRAILDPLAQGDVEVATRALERHIDNSMTIALGGTVT
ncbi:MAG: GntR family transcriptional regulator [Fulvimarina manganoxydans]|nr:GntR family transcriptional regulator [Fulvimarina manganoxydans]